MVKVNWTAAGSSDPLVTGIRYALYSQCGAQTTFQLITNDTHDDIQGLSYNITTLPTLTQCVLRVVVYSDHCLLDVNGPTSNATAPFRTGKVASYHAVCISSLVQTATSNFIQALIPAVIYQLVLSSLQPCTVCPANEYVAASPESCQPCPAMSSSPGGVVQVCPCMDGTGRVNESDPSLPCVGESLRRPDLCVLNCK